MNLRIRDADAHESESLSILSTAPVRGNTFVTFCKGSLTTSRNSRLRIGDALVGYVHVAGDVASVLD